MEQIANPVFNSDVATQLVSGGHVWVAVGLIIFQLAILPIMSNLFKRWTEHNKKLIDAERLATKLERDNQYNMLNLRMDNIESKQKTDIDNLKTVIDDIKKMMDKFDIKLDKMLELNSK